MCTLFRAQIFSAFPFLGLTDSQIKTNPGWFGTQSRLVEEGLVKELFMGGTHASIQI